MQPLRASLRHCVQQRMQQDPAHDLAHLDRVWINAQTIAASLNNVNLRVLLGAAYLHDLINLPKDAPNRNTASALSAKAAAPILRDLGYTPSEIDATGHAITAHSFSANIPPNSPEAEILRDADRLDALGAIGIARTFVVAGATARALYDPADPFACNRALDDQMWAIDHWQVKLLKLPDDMLTTKGREIAERRAGLMRDYLSQLADEIAIPLTG
jgi:uncharacterized protein